ncbi:MAG: acyltransferase [Desulfovibrio sp.]|nr:acyltransferase [Desulfovibrio sp.]
MRQWFKRVVMPRLAAQVLRLQQEALASRDFSPWCQCGPGSRIHPEGRIANIAGGAERIRMGAHTHLRGELLTFGHGGDIELGDYCYVGEGTRIWSALSIRIGHRVLISHAVNIFDCDTHPIDDPAARHRQFKEIITTGHPRHLQLNEQPVIIEDDALICCQVVILPGVTIGRGAVVGAGSVVTRDVPPMTLVAGNPARIIRPLNPGAADI